MRPSALYKNKMFFGTDDAFSRSVEIVVTPAIFAAIGWVTPLWAALGVSASSLLMVLNALRLSRLPSQRRPDSLP